MPTILAAELTAHLGAERDERTEERRGYRNGHTPRTLTTRVGRLALPVPQARDGAFSPEPFGRSQRSEQALVLSFVEMDLPGGSTRQVAALTEQFCGTPFAKRQVATLTGRRDAEWQRWRERPLETAYP